MKPLALALRSKHPAPCSPLLGLLALSFLLLAQSPTLHAQSVRINEVMASNGTTLADEDGDFEDWIELHNYGTEPVDLSGWGLSDSYNNPFKWTFPEGTTIDAGAYLLVWASGKDRVTEVEVSVPHIPSTAIWKFDDRGVDPGYQWMTVAFDDNEWAVGQGAFGNGKTFSFVNEVSPSATTYFRKNFFVDRPELLEGFMMSLRTNLGAVFYLNGVEVGRHLMPQGQVSHGTPSLDIPLDGLALWVASDGPMQTREEDGRTFVTQWTDLSGHNRNLFQEDLAAQPQLAGGVLNGRPAVRFDGLTQRMITKAFDTNSDVTLFMVARASGGASWARLFAKGSSDAGFSLMRRGDLASYIMRLDTTGQLNQQRSGTSPVFDGQWRMFALGIKENLLQMRLNGETDVLGNFNVGDGVGNNRPFVLASNYAAGGHFTEADVAEVILFDRALTESEILAVENYLHAKHFVEVISQFEPAVTICFQPLVSGLNTFAVSLHQPPSGVESSIFHMTLDGLSTKRSYHTPFSLSSSGEEVILSLPDGTRVDELEPRVLPRDISIGRVEGEGSTWFFFDEPTPGGKNTSKAYLGILDPPTFSHTGGFFSEGFNLILSHKDPGVTIIYSMDGSNPSIENLEGTTYLYKNQFPRNPEEPFGDFLEHTFYSHLYTGAISLTDRSPEPDKLTQISSTVEFSPSYFPDSAVRKARVIQARAFRENYIPSFPAGHTYFINPDEHRFTLPVVSLQIQENLLFDYYIGVYTAGVDFDLWRQANPDRVFPVGLPILQQAYNSNRRGDEWEYPARLEYFDSWASGNAAVNQGMGFRIHGNVSRQFPMKGMRLYARSKYDLQSTFTHNFFPDSPLLEGVADGSFFQRLFLRGRSAGGSFINDVVVHTVLQPVFHGVLRVQPIVKFINGEFWGLTALRDRFDHHHLSFNYGFDLENLIITSRAVLDYGLPKDSLLVNQFFDFLRNGDFSNAEVFYELEQQLCLLSYIDHLIAGIYFGEGNYEYGFWRAREPQGKGVLDGRWRAYINDFDEIFRSHVNMLENRLERAVGFQNLLSSERFRLLFLNRFADHINTTFSSDRVAPIVFHFRDLIAPYLPEDSHRWSRNFVTNYDVHRWITYLRERPDAQRTILVEFFNLSGVLDLTLATHLGGENCRVRVNTIRIDDFTPGVPANPYPWTGTYFQGVPIELEALPEPGHRFVGWVVTATNGMAPMAEGGEPDFYSTDAVISLDLAEDTTVEAVFEAIPLADLPVAIHAWDFEDAGAVLSPSFTVGGAALMVSPGTHPDWEAISNTGGDFATRHLRVNFPLGSTLTFSLPTTGFEAITFDFLTRRSGQGAEHLFVEYTLDGETWTSALDEPDFLTVFNAPPQPQSFDFSAVPGVSDNADFAVRFTFAQGADGGTAGNNRFDDVVLSGVALPETNLPPVVLPEALEVVELAAERGRALDLDTWFADPEEDALSFSVVSLGGGVVSADIVGSVLILTGLSAGEGSVVVSASDGQNPPVTHTARLLVYGAPHAVASGDFVFSEWDPLTPAGVFPANMLFVQSNVNDPDLVEPLLFAYSIAGDAHADDDAALPYNATSRTRLNGLGEAGISFINTGRGRDLGGAVLSLDTTGASDVRVSFTAGTVLANSRIYGLRLQYRVGLSGEWADVTDGGLPVEYVRSTDGDAVEFAPIFLPSAAANEALVQLRWKYHHISGTSGPRAMLRLDDIVVTSGEAGAATALAYGPFVPTVAQSGLPPGAVELRAVDGEGALDTDFSGTVTLSLLGKGVLSGTLSVAAVDGVALFDDWVVTGGDGVFELLATAPGLSPALSDPIILSAFPVFLPGGDGDWTLGANWTSGTIPSGAGAGARVPAPALADRNVNLRAPVTIGSVFMETGAEGFRNRLRDRSTGNTLTFHGGAGSEAHLRVEGTGTGFVELQNEAGTILATDLRLTVNAIYGDAEYGALRLRDGWMGEGGLIKDGPGMAALTGDGKAFTGAILIEEGVLAFTEPAVPANASGVTVLDGGQLRLYSGSSESNPVRVHTFGGAISLSGSGRTGVPEGEELGVLGALRYDPYSQNNVAVLTNPIHFAATASVHVDGSRNELTLSGPLAGSGHLVKSGGGVVVLVGGGAAHTGGIFATNGRLHVEAAHPSSVSLGADAWLSGTGVVGAISGAGTVRVEGGVLTASSLHGSSLRALLDGPGLTGNGLLRLSGEAPVVASPAVLDLLVRTENLAPGARLRGGLFVPEGVDLLSALAGTLVRIWLPDVEGALEDGGANYRLAEPADLLSWAVVPGEVAGDGGPVAGWMLEVRRGGSPVSFSQWVGLEVSDPADQADPSVAGPEADPTGSGVTNLERYAFGLSLTEAPWVRLPRLNAGGTLFEFPLDLSLTDLTYRVRSSADLQDWGTVEYDSRIDATPVPVDGWLSLPVDFNPRRFYRLELILEP